jgi:hypothetical protein
MKKIILSVAVATTLFSTAAFSASDIHLQIKSSKGSSQVLSCPNGACVVPSLVADTYTFSIVDAQGKPVSVSSPMSCDVKSPRDSASGLATGKRQHQPIHISSELSSSSVVVAQDESNLAITCSSSGAAVSATAAKTATYDLKKATK